jgi:putative ABC transport system substrate-binding protein
MKRRDFVAGLGSAAAWPVMARGQQQVMPVIGYLSAQSADESKNLTVAFLQSLKETGYVVGQTLRSNTTGRTIKPIGCRRLQPISSAAA